MANKPENLKPFKKGEDPRRYKRKGGEVSITTLIKKKLKELPPNQKKTFLELTIDKILHKALVEGDSKMLQLIWAYVDGQPTQKVEQKFEKPFPIEIKVLPPKKVEELEKNKKEALPDVRENVQNN